MSEMICKEWTERRKEFLLCHMSHYCRKYYIKGWAMKFVDIQEVFGFEAGAICHRQHKTIYMNTKHLGANVAPLWHRDAFLHEFAHLLNFENGIKHNAVGMYGYNAQYSLHGRDFRKMAYKLGVGKQCIPSLLSKD